MIAGGDYDISANGIRDPCECIAEHFANRLGVPLTHGFRWFTLASWT